MSTLADLLMTAADGGPDAVAIRDRGTGSTWADAATAAARIGASLDEAGVRPGDRVGVHHRKGADGFLAMHAVVQRGAIAVPLDPSAPPGYLAAVLDQTGCEVVTTHGPCQRSALALATTGRIRAIVGLDRPEEPADAETANAETTDAGTTDNTSTGNTSTDETAGCRFIGPAAIGEATPVTPRRPDPDDLAYIITTSGSTGVPKGIAHTHRSALAHVAFMRQAYDLDPADRISDIAPHHFDISTLALWATPAVGATNVIVPEPHQMLPASLSELAAAERITVWYSVPYLLTQLLHRGQIDDRDLSAIRLVLFGGEAVPPLTLADLMRKLPGARFSNVYGPAEVNACTIHHLDGPPVDEEPIPIGGPVGDTEVRLVDLDDPDSDRGEIWVSAPTMMAGYWRRPDLDARSIVADATGRRWYRTGDLGRRLSSGELVFTGRVDHQVKVRGHRIELEAIEAILEDAPGIGAAVAAVVRSPDGDDVIIAGLATADGTPIDETAVRRHATSNLPAYAVPTALRAIDRLPTTGSGKLDRRNIRASLAASTD